MAAPRPARLPGLLLVTGAILFAPGAWAAPSPFAPQWLALLHFDSAANESRVDHPAFFASETGKTDPAAELDAFIAALRDPGRRLGQWQLPADCAFPARARWVRSHIDNLPPAPSCLKWEKWRQGLNGKQVSIVYSSSYTGSPGSMFGHTFLKIGPRPGAAFGEGSDLLSYAVSYAADTGDANAVSYVYHGLTGGFTGRVSVQPYYLKVKEYAFSEERDLWEYPLALTLDQVDMLVAHIWELYSSGGFAYYFLDENCAGVLLSVLDTARPEWQLWQRRPATVSPLAALQLLAKTPGAIGETRYRPSPAKQTRRMINLLDIDQQNSVKQMLSDRLTASGVQDPRVLEATIAILQARKFNLEGQLLERDRHVLEASLSQRASLPKLGPPSVPTPPAAHSSTEPAGPASAHKPAAISSAWLSRQGLARLSLRHGYHELGDAPAGYDENLAIKYLSPSVLLASDRVMFERLTLLEMSALASWSAYSRAPSWQLHTSCTQQQCDLTGGAGISLPLASRGVAYLIPKLALNNLGWAGAEWQWNAGLLWRALGWFTFDSQAVYHLRSDGTSYWTGRAGSRWNLSENFQIVQEFDSWSGLSAGFTQFF